MPDRTEVVLSWSGGKDSALALDELRRDGRFEVVALLTTIAEPYRRISHHGVRVELLERQAEAVGLPLHPLILPADPDGCCTNEQYEAAMRRAMLRYRDAGIATIAFGDLFLRDLREYRERTLGEVGMGAIFPLWGRDTAGLARRFVAEGYRAFLCCVDGQKLDASFAGRPLDAALLDDLPEGVDPCGENGEYHSFVFDGPIFGEPVGVRVGEVVARDVRHFADLLPADGPATVAGPPPERPEGRPPSEYRP